MSLKRFDINASLRLNRWPFSSYKVDIVKLLCGQCFGNCYKQQTYVTVVAIFKIALTVIF